MSRRAHSWNIMAAEIRRHTDGTPYLRIDAKGYEDGEYTVSLSLADHDKLMLLYNAIGSIWKK